MRETSRRSAGRPASYVGRPSDGTACSADLSLRLIGSSVDMVGEMEPNREKIYQTKVIIKSESRSKSS